MPQSASTSIGRSLRLFLVEGTATGLIIAEIVNWTGKVLVVPRAALPQFLARPEAANTGIYILSGSDPEEPLRPMVYIGESEVVGARLRQHEIDEKKDFYERAIVFVSKDENLTKAHARYLEGRLVAKVRDAARAKSLNGNDPGLSPLPEADRSDMEFFITQVELVLPVLGLDIVRPQIELPAAKPAHHAPAASATEPNESPVFVFTETGTNAEAQEVGNEFVVKSGSIAREAQNPSAPGTTILLRKQYIDDGTLISIGNGQLRFTRDVAFRSPSGAAGVIIGGSINGRWYWKEKGTSRSYGDWRDRMLNRADGSSPQQSVDSTEPLEP